MLSVLLRTNKSQDCFETVNDAISEKADPLGIKDQNAQGNLTTLQGIPLRNTSLLKQV